VLTAAQRLGSPDGYRSHTLHVEPDGSFSIVALVWRPGQITRIHDHVTWCAFGVIQGVEHEELFDTDLSTAPTSPASTPAPAATTTDPRSRPQDVAPLQAHGRVHA
jgi:predicted metal-dependent enzyme (double-stranded beta helix superfamily)